jgi:precorrin-8X/cobalt-precorrin-8 methylmutase
MPHSFETDGAAIYRQSFAMIRAEADLARFTPEEDPVVVRMIHAAGMVGLERDVRFSSGMAIAARAALEAGAPILCDARMVSEGITRPRRPAAIIGCPVGFVGAAESKDALMADLPVPALIVQGRLGGSAIAVAAVNALASRKE